MKFNLDVVEISHIDELLRVHSTILAAGLADTLKNAQAIALFAPENEAFDKLQRSTIMRVVFAVRDLRDELIHLNPIVVHGARRQVTLGGVLNSPSSLNWLGT